jgi:hypothetical protein
VRPHKTEAVVKPAIEARNNLVPPNLAERKPFGAIMIAAATM